MSKTPKSSFSFQNSHFRFNFFFDQNLDFVLGLPVLRSFDCDDVKSCSSTGVKQCGESLLIADQFRTKLCIEQLEESDATWFQNFFVFWSIYIVNIYHVVPISLYVFLEVLKITLAYVEEKFGEQNFRVISEMRILGKNRVAILDFGRVSRFF